MRTYTAKEIIEKILRRDYDRWIQYTDDGEIDREAYDESYYTWKQKKGYYQEDAKLISELLE